MMIKRYYQRKEAKCNFCFQWFHYEGNVKYSIHLCGPCLEKALKNTCYIVPSPDGKQFYQLYLFKNNLKIAQQTVEQEEQSNQLKNSFLENIDDYRNNQLKKLSSKWAQITSEIQKLSNFGQQEMRKFTQLFDQSLKSYPNAQQILNRKEKEEIFQQKVNFEKNKNKENENKGDEVTETQSKIGTGTISGRNSNIIGKARVSKPNILNLCTTPIRKPLKEMKKSAIQPLQSQKTRIDNNKLTERQNKLKKPDETTTKLKIQDLLSEKKYVRSPSNDSKFDASYKKKVQPFVFTKQKRQKDLQMIAQNALKSKIYHYLQTSSTVPPALYLPMTLDIYDAIQNTSSLNKCIQLVSHNLQEIDVKCYLTMFDWAGVDVLKLVKVGLSDEQFREILVFVKEKRIETLVVTSNKLTEDSILQLKDYSVDMPFIRNVYLGRNRIKKTKIRDSIKQIETRFLLYL